MIVCVLRKVLKEGTRLQKSQCQQVTDQQGRVSTSATDQMPLTCQVQCWDPVPKARYSVALRQEWSWGRLTPKEAGLILHMPRRVSPPLGLSGFLFGAAGGASVYMPSSFERVRGCSPSLVYLGTIRTTMLTW